MCPITDHQFTDVIDGPEQKDAAGSKVSMCVFIGTP